MDPNVCAKVGHVDCRSAGRLLASMLEYNVRNVPYNQIVQFYSASGCLEETDTVGNVIQSYVEWTSRITGSMVKEFYDAISRDSDCGTEICQAWYFPGNADFAGIGILVAFCIQISIATCFAVFYLYLFFRHSKEVPFPFRSTFHTFFISTVFFNVAIGLAATLTVGLGDNSQYTAFFVPLGSLLSLASTQTMWALYRKIHNTPREFDDTAKKKVRPSMPVNTGSSTETRLLRLCLALLWINLLAIYALVIRMKFATPFEVFCFAAIRGRSLAIWLMYTQVALISLGLICTALKMIFRQDGENKRWGWLGPTTTAYGLVVMWLAFGIFWSMRTQLGSIAGDGYKDNDWGFGQIAAVAALFPTVVDIVRESFKLLKGNDQAEEHEGGRKETREEDQIQDEDVDGEEDESDVGEETDVLDGRV